MNISKQIADLQKEKRKIDDQIRNENALFAVLKEQYNSKISKLRYRDRQLSRELSNLRLREDMRSEHISWMDKQENNSKNNVDYYTLLDLIGKGKDIQNALYHYKEKFSPNRIRDLLQYSIRSKNSPAIATLNLHIRDNNIDVKVVNQYVRYKDPEFAVSCCRRC